MNNPVDGEAAVVALAKRLEQSGRQPCRVGVLEDEPADGVYARQLDGKASDALRIVPCTNATIFLSSINDHPGTHHVLILHASVETVLDALDHLPAFKTSCPFIIAVEEGEDYHALRFLALGAAAVLPSSVVSEQLTSAVDIVSTGYGIVGPTVLAAFVAPIPVHVDAEGGLTSQETAWLNWLAEGTSVEKVAVRAGWSERQMRRKLGGLYLRLGATNRDQAVARASRLGLLGEKGP